MKLNMNCILCNIRQVLTVTAFTKSSPQEQQQAMREVLSYLATTEYNRSNPEVIRGTWEIITKHLQDRDPYRKIKTFYNKKLLALLPAMQQQIAEAPEPFFAALKMAVAANLIDFAASAEIDDSLLLNRLRQARTEIFAIDDSPSLYSRLAQARSLLYLGDNCGEIVVDRLFIEQIKKEFPQLQVYFGVRGEPIVNDVTLADAAMIKMEQVATVLSNGDGSLGTVLERTSEQFKQVFQDADVVIAKGQGNYESLSETKHRSLFFLFMAKCEVVATAAGVSRQAILCQEHHAI